MMTRTTNRVLRRLFPVMVIASMAAMAMSGCNIKEDRSCCRPIVSPEPGIEEVMVVTAVDAGTGEVITVSEKVQDGSLFFFDNDLILRDYTPVEKSQLGQYKPMPIKVDRLSSLGDTIWVSAWGNIEGNFNVVGTYAIGEDNLFTRFLNIMPNSLWDGFYTCPGEILFGMSRIIMGKKDPESNFDSIETKPDGTQRLVHEIRITQINALLWIQVEGLPGGFDPEQYYFRINRQNNGYDYQGLPFGGDELRSIREVGIMQNGNLVVEQPYNLVPSLDGDIGEDDAVHLHLYQIAPTRAEEDIDLTGPVSKVDYGDGDYIGLYGGKTTNVYIRFLPTGDMEVHVKITDWGEIYQWTIWDN